MEAGQFIINTLHSGAIVVLGIAVIKLARR